MNAMPKTIPNPTVRPETPAGANISPATINVRRRIAAPAQALFDAWLDPVSLASWLRPGSTVNTDARITPEVGGSFEIDMHQPDAPSRCSARRPRCRSPSQPAPGTARPRGDQRRASAQAGPPAAG